MRHRFLLFLTLFLSFSGTVRSENRISPEENLALMQERFKDQPWIRFREMVLLFLQGATVDEVAGAIEISGLGQVTDTADASIPRERDPDDESFIIYRYLDWYVTVPSGEKYDLALKLIYNIRKNGARTQDLEWGILQSLPNTEDWLWVFHEEDARPQQASNHSIWTHKNGRYAQKLFWDSGRNPSEISTFHYLDSGKLEKIVCQAQNGRRKSCEEKYANKPLVGGSALSLLPDPHPDSGYLFPQPDETVIAVWDTGVNPNHSRLKGKLVGILPSSDWSWGFDLQGGPGGGDRNPYDFYYLGFPPCVVTHGTGSLYLCVQDPGLRAFPIRIDMHRNYERSISLSKTFGARIVNMSFACDLLFQLSWNESHPVLTPLPIDNGDAACIREIASHPEILFVVAAGNSGLDVDQYPTFPAALPQENVLTVAAKRLLLLTPWSTYGELTCDVATQGERHVTLEPERKKPSSGHNGTSYSAPLVSCLAGRILNTNPVLTPDKVREIIMKTATIYDFNRPLAVRSGGVTDTKRALAVTDFLARHPGTAVEEAINAIEGQEYHQRLMDYWRNRLVVLREKFLRLDPAATDLPEAERWQRARDWAATVPPGDFWKKSLLCSPVMAKMLQASVTDGSGKSGATKNASSLKHQHLRDRLIRWQ